MRTFYGPTLPFDTLRPNESGGAARNEEDQTPTTLSSATTPQQPQVDRAASPSLLSFPGGDRAAAMSRRPVHPSRRVAEEDGTAPAPILPSQRPRPSSLLPAGLVLLGALVLVAYSYAGSGLLSGGDKVSPENEGLSCTSEVQRSMPFLKKAYGDAMLNVLHVGPDTCSVVSKFLKEGTEAWGIEPYELDDADDSCKRLLRKGIVRVADIKFPLPYRPKSFSVVVVSDVLEYLTPKYLNKTLPELARVSKNGLVLFAGYPGKQRPRSLDLPKFGRPAKLRSSSWWIRFFVQTQLYDNEAAMKKFEQATSRKGYTPSCQVFHLRSSVS